VRIDEMANYSTCLHTGFENLTTGQIGSERMDYLCKLIQIIRIKI